MMNAIFSAVQSEAAKNRSPSFSRSSSSADDDQFAAGKGGNDGIDALVSVNHAMFFTQTAS